MGMLPAAAPAQNRQLGAGQGAPARANEEEVHAEIEDDVPGERRG
jgi:hypothetical protein